MASQSRMAAALVWVLLLPLTASGQEPSSWEVERRAPEVPVRPGVDVLLQDSLHLVEGRRVGLVTNHTGVSGGDGAAGGDPSNPFSARPTSTIDLLWEHPEVELVALFSPEHGIRGDAEAGVLVDSDVDEETGLPIHSLYGDTRSPPPGSLDDVDVLLFDIQDIGTRYYTYIYTMALAMEEAGREGVPFVVLDRPNPIGGRLVQGNVLDPEFASFVGMYPIPMRHGMTPGELALLFQGTFGIQVDLHVVPVEGWEREMLFSDTGLPWVSPSPNMPSLESAVSYPGTCLFEGTNLSVGRGTDRPFQLVGAPWLPADRLALELNQYGIPGVDFRAVRVTPRDPGDGKFDGEEIQAVQLVVHNPDVFDPTLAGVAMLAEIRRMAGHNWEWRASHFDRLAGTDELREGLDRGLGVQELRSGWLAQLQEFLELREAYLLYR